MKKIILVLMVMLTVFNLTGCKKEEEPISEVEPNIVGGWNEEEKEMNDELIAIFEKACESYTGMGFEPIKLLATQVVSGTNYKFLANGTVVYPGASASQKIVTVYEDLQGNCSITNVEDYLDPSVEALGGWMECDLEIDEELKSIFEKACESWTGMKLEPVKLIGSQVVAGKNYEFYAKGTAVVPNAEPQDKIVVIYQDLDGNCSITSVEDVIALETEQTN